MSEEWDEYLKDSRIICKYGNECYQKNPEHHKKYKHPPQLKAKAAKKQKNNRFQPYNKVKNVNVETKDEKNIEEAVEELKEMKCNVDNQASGSTEKIDNGEIEASQGVQKLCVKTDNISFHNRDSDHTILKECFLVEMPTDFFKFYEYLKEDSEDIEKMLASVNLQLIGPFELFLGKLPKLEDKDLYLIHWRFYFDPPEFQVCILVFYSHKIFSRAMYFYILLISLYINLI